jgi:hypothetical protein
MYYTIPFFKKSFKISDIFHTVIILVINECGTVLQYILTICRPLKSHGDADREHIGMYELILWAAAMCLSTGYGIIYK